MKHAAYPKIDDLVWKKCVFLWGKQQQKKAPLNAIAAHCAFKINASFYLFAFLLSTFFSRLLQAAPRRRYFPGDIDYLSRKDITKKFRREIKYFKRRLTEEDEECVSTILPF